MLSLIIGNRIDMELNMDFGIGVLLGSLVGALVVALISFIYSGRRQAAIEQENIMLKARIEADDGNLDKFKNIASEVLADQTAKSNTEIRKTLDPLRENINNFKNRIEDLNKERAADNHALKEHINTLHQTSIQVSEEASNLTNALRSDKSVQGNWGEVILERLLEQSGLEKGREYFIQQSITDEQGARKRPDVIIKLPDDKSIIVDSKVSLNAYNDYCNSDDEVEQAIFLKKHIKAIDTHIQQLSAKDYEKLPGVNSLDYTLLFFPLEAAFLAAQKEDPSLFERGIAKNIILVTPSTLLATLKVIHNLWRNEKRVMNAQNIASEGGKLYDKFVGFVEDMNKLGKSLESAQQSFDGATNKLYQGRGNLITQTQRMSESAKKLDSGQNNKLLKEQDAAEENDVAIVDNLENMKKLGADAKKSIGHAS